MPDRRFNKKFHFRFTQDEVAEMENYLKENNNISPQSKVVKALALKFSKARHLRGQSYVRSDSVHNWFTRRRNFTNKKIKGLSWVKSPKTSILSSVSKMQQSPVEFKDKLDSHEEEASSDDSSEEESYEGKSGEGTSQLVIPSSSVSNSVQIVDQMDASHSHQLVPVPQSPVSDSDIVLARLVKFKNVQQGVSSKTSLDQNDFRTPSSGESAYDVVDRAKATLGKLGGISLADFKCYQRDFEMAICVILEKGSLSDMKKAELLLLKERILKIYKENVQAREELSECHYFREKIIEAAESVDKLMKKADLLEEKYKKFPKDISAASRKVLEVEAALLQAKAELEIMKGDQDDVYNKLAKLRESLESVNKDRMSLKAEEALMMKKRVEAEVVLEKSTEEWIQCTHPKAFTVI
ncbi:unnamed protein product [Rhodiola kirilowii]